MEDMNNKSELFGPIKPKRSLVEKIALMSFGITFSVGAIYILMSLFPESYLWVSLFFGVIVAWFEYWKNGDMVFKRLKVLIEEDDKYKDMAEGSAKISRWTYAPVFLLNMIGWTFTLAAMIFDFPKEMKEAYGKDKENK